MVDLAKLDERTRRGQWHAFNEVLGYLNTLETKVIPKKDIYAAVMEMRPKVDLPAPAVHLLREAYTAMRVASALPGVSSEYDFGPAMSAIAAALDLSSERGR